MRFSSPYGWAVRMSDDTLFTTALMGGLVIFGVLGFAVISVLTRRNATRSSTMLDQAEEQQKRSQRQLDQTDDNNDAFTAAVRRWDSLLARQETLLDRVEEIVKRSEEPRSTRITSDADKTNLHG